MILYDFHSHDAELSYTKFGITYSLASVVGGKLGNV